MAKKNKSKPELKVVFETSVLFTKVAYELLRSEVKELIKSNSQHSDLNIKWYLSIVVVDERRYQMQCAAFELLPSVTKLERLLGHNLNITEDILKVRVDEAIEKQLSELGISTLDIDTSQVDWKSLMRCAIYRLPPFEPGDKEKGFRDSLIAETFLQLVSQSPTTPSVCRLAFISNDGLLSEYIKSRTKDAKNVRILSTVSELEGLINTLVSQVTEEFIAEIKEKVSNYFFETEDKASLYYKENIRDKINELYGEQIVSVPKAELQRENGTWWIGKPVFVKKKQQRTFWMTLISIEAKLFKYELTPTQTYPSFGITSGIGGVLSPNIDYSGITPGISGALSPNIDYSGIISGIGGALSPNIDYSGITPGMGGTLAGTSKMKKIDVAMGQSRFEIHWSVNITQTKKFTYPRIEEIKFVATKWGGE